LWREGWGKRGWGEIARGRNAPRMEYAGKVDHGIAQKWRPTIESSKGVFANHEILMTAVCLHAELLSLPHRGRSFLLTRLVSFEVRAVNSLGGKFKRSSNEHAASDAF